MNRDDWQLLKVIVRETLAAIVLVLIAYGLIYALFFREAP